jgi:catechol 2,3-dioxygenase-like lactoylglutathione lyase family enzyme
MLQILDTNITIMVADMDRSISFYESLGMKLKNRWGNHYAMIEGYNIVLGIHPEHEPVIANSKVSIGFLLTNLEDATKLLDSKGIKYATQDDKSGKFASFNDPDGIFLYFMQPGY